MVILVVKTENDWRYFGLVVVGNYVIHSKNFFVVDCSIWGLTHEGRYHIGWEFLPFLPQSHDFSELLTTQNQMRL